jgi:hypothetical protein
MEENRGCYRFITRTYETSLFGDAVDATYIIHLKNNGRESSIEAQLSQTQPTNIVYVVENQGYKNCQKKLHEYKPAHDLTDAFLQVFRHADHHHYNNILILEDDYLFAPNVQKECSEIGEFIKTKKEKFIYSLGCVPYLQSTGLSNHNRLYLSTGTHACIYSKQLREHVLSHKQCDITDWDVFHNFRSTRYVYHKPLCYQIYSSTENSKHWYNPLGAATLLKNIHSLTGVDKTPEPGHAIHYLLSKLLYVLMCFLLLYASVVILQSLASQKNGRKIQRKGYL